MYAVGRLGSYITRGVYSVSNPFHPFSGAIDIIVVEQQNGSLKSSPWYVQFGKFQGVLKSKENVVNLNVNGVDADFSMYLDNKGEAYFIREVFGEEDTSDLSLSSLRDSTDGKGSISPRFVKTRSCNYDSGRERLVSQIERGDGEILSRNGTSGPKAFGLVFRSSSALETGMYPQERTFQEDREGSLERAEIAANLLEVRWSTNLPPSKSQKGNTRRVSDLDLPDGAQDQQCSHVENNTQEKTICDHDKAETRLSNGPDNHIEAFTLQEAYLDASLASDSSRSSSQTHSIRSILTEGSEDTDKGTVQEMSKLNPNVLHSTEGNGVSTGDKSGNTVNILDSAHGSRPERAHSFTSYDTSDCLNERGSMGSDEGPSQELFSACSACEEVDGTARIIGNSMDMRCHVGSKLPPRIPECRTDRSVGSIEPRNLNEHLTKTDNSTGKNSFINEAPNFIASDNELHRDTVAEDTIPHFRGQELDTVGISGSCEERVNESGDILDDSNLATDNPKQDNTSQLKMSIISSDSCSTARAPKDINDRTQTADSLPSLVSNSPLCNSPDSNSGIISLIEDEIPALEMEAAKQLQSELCSAPSEDLLVLDDISGSLDMETDKRHKLASASFKYTQIETEIRKILLEPAAEISLCGHLLKENMGYEAAAVAFDSEKLDMGKIASMGSDLIKDDRLVVRIGGLYFPWEAALDIVSKIGTDEQILEPKGMITVGHVEKSGEDPQKLLDTKKSKWTLWPFLANKSNNMDGQPSTLVESEKSCVDMPDTADTCKDEEALKKKVVKAKTPTSEQLVSLNLKEGKNIVTFTYSTEMLGEQQVDARIFLWKWDARIVISDVDGTITKSDVLGQFMPLMGYDWTQTGVTHLFSAIKENGYELLFLSARAISQACITRQFLINLKQDGKPLPEGPIVISPDGLFPSLFREVIRRAPHEFKIACLEDIKALFPPDTNPFYAGFGNRDTDEVSYLKVGIPKGKIFIINPKGEVAVHRRVDTKSYTSLHTLVHNIFPPPSSVPITEQEDYNTWNFWKLPPPDFRS